MPWMPDKMPSLPNEALATTNGNAAQRTPAPSNRDEVRAMEKRILSSVENLNEILSLVVLVDVCSLDY